MLAMQECGYDQYEGILSAKGQVVGTYMCFGTQDKNGGLLFNDQVSQNFLMRDQLLIIGVPLK